MTTTPKLDAAIARVNRDRAAEGLHPLPRHKAIAQLGAERIVEFAKARGMDVSCSTMEMIAWLILEPVIEDVATSPPPAPDRRGTVDCCRNCERNLLVPPLLRRFIVCPTCGNKRCPKATHHDHACTGSNEPGQPGSDYA